MYSPSGLMSSSLFINLNTGNVKAVIILLMEKYSNDLAFLNYLDEISIRNGGKKKKPNYKSLHPL